MKLNLTPIQSGGIIKQLNIVCCMLDLDGSDYDYYSISFRLLGYAGAVRMRVLFKVTANFCIREVRVPRNPYKYENMVIYVVEITIMIPISKITKNI